MSISAKIRTVIGNQDGTATLYLDPWEDDPAGQPTLTIVNPPDGDIRTLARALEGQQIWGGAADIMVGTTKFAKRIGYTRIELVEALSEGDA